MEVRSIGVKSIGTWDADENVSGTGGVASRSASVLDDGRGFLLALESARDSVPAAGSAEDRHAESGRCQRRAGRQRRANSEATKEHKENWMCTLKKKHEKNPQQTCVGSTSRSL